MFSSRLWHDLRTYYRGCRGRDLQEFYDLESRLPYFDHVGHILGAHKRRILLAWMRDVRVHGPILELGSGIGTFARQLATQAYHVAAVDISSAKTRKGQLLTARQWGDAPAPVQHFVGDLRQIGTGTALDGALRQAYGWSTLPAFEVVLAADILEHLPDAPEETLRHIHQLMAPHGRLFASVPSWLCRHDPGHFWTLLPQDWERLFTASGFYIQRQRMSRICWYGLPTPLPLAMVYELRPGVQSDTQASRQEVVTA